MYRQYTAFSDQGRECHELEKDTLAKHSNGDILDTDEEAERDQVMQYSIFVTIHCTEEQNKPMG